VKPEDLATKSTVKVLLVVFCAIISIASACPGVAQSIPYQRAFPQSRTVVEKHLKELQSSSAGRLPVLESFTVPSDRPLDRFQRGYYQCAAQVSSTPSGGSLVRVHATITAWYRDPVSAKSGYEVLPSNGRLEADFLDRLQEALGDSAASSTATPIAKAQPLPRKNQPDAPEPVLSAPMPGDSARGLNPKTSPAAAGSPFKLGDPLSLHHTASLAIRKAVVARHAEEQGKEARGLEEILRNQAHPGNLVAVKRTDTPVLASPSEDAKVMFLAAAEDEFEILDMNANWVHVRISGLSRGWIRRSSLEMPAVDPDTQPAETEQYSEPAAADKQSFQVEHEQVGSFPGNWEPLQGKTVRIVSVQKVNDNATATGSGAKLEFAKSLFKREYADLAKAPTTTIAGVVVIFDSEDGGMVAATVPALRQWTAGTLSDEAFWRRCFVDPPEVFTPVTKN
jgi:hypothetical protein